MNVGSTHPDRLVYYPVGKLNYGSVLRSMFQLFNGDLLLFVFNFYLRILNLTENLSQLGKLLVKYLLYGGEGAK
ncbi:MAG: hypothetical protein Q9N34_08190 [Aquificota bacterium]|nr:hypothetical protein [Aquificota bacterium]